MKTVRLVCPLGTCKLRISSVARHLRCWQALCTSAWSGAEFQSITSPPLSTAVPMYTTAVTTPCARLAITIISSCVPIDVPLAVPTVFRRWALLPVSAAGTKSFDKDAIREETGQYLRLRARLQFPGRGREWNNYPGVLNHWRETSSTWTRCRSSRVFFCRSLASLTALAYNGRSWKSLVESRQALAERCCRPANSPFCRSRMFQHTK